MRKESEVGCLHPTDHCRQAVAGKVHECTAASNQVRGERCGAKKVEEPTH